MQGILKRSTPCAELSREPVSCSLPRTAEALEYGSRSQEQRLKKHNDITFRLRMSARGVYYVHWTCGRRSRRVSTRTGDATAARTFLSLWLAERDPTKATPPRVPTCGELWDFYLDRHVARKCVNGNTQLFAWKALGPTFAKLRPNDVSQAVIDAYVLKRSRRCKPSSLHPELSLLRASWTFAIKKRQISASEVPAVGDLDFPQPPPPRERWLREHEAERLFIAAAEMRNGPRLSRVERFMWLALETAGRRTCLLNLTWDQVDFETRVVHLNPDGRQQSSKRRASVPISDALLDVLEVSWAERTSDLVLDYNHRLHEHLDRVAARANVKGVTAHVFRHTAATWMARRGVPLWKIAKVLGNSVEQVERVYAKHCPDDLRDSVNVISGEGAHRTATLRGRRPLLGTTVHLGNLRTPH